MDMGSNQPVDNCECASDDNWWAAVLKEAEVAEAHSGPPVEGGALRRGVPGESNAADEWEKARRLCASEEAVELDVVGYNRGGLLVNLNSLRGFVPASHLVGFGAGGLMSEEDRKACLASRVGERLRLKVIECDVDQRRVVFSERAALAGPGARQQVLHKLRPGDVVAGQVTNICDFGAFVDLGGLEGLVHVSEMSWNRVTHPRDVLRCNQTVKAVVVAVDADQGRVALSLKRLYPDPWDSIEQRYLRGQMVEGVVTNVVNFGAFVCLEDGVEALIHVSELAEGHFLHPRNVVREGEHVRARVVNVDRPNRRLALSLRQAA
jgi:small subunit ribosomal protein S1